MQVKVALCRPWRLIVNDEVALHTLLTLALDVSALRLGHNPISVLYQRCIAVCARSKNVPSKVCHSAKRKWRRIWHNRMHCDVTEVEVIGFFPLWNRRRCSWASGLRKHTNMLGVLREGLGNRYPQPAMLILALHRDLPLPLRLHL